MTVGLASAKASALLEAFVGSTAYTPPALIALKLHVADPGVAGATSPAAGDTTRKTVTFGAATGAGVKSMTAMSGSWTNGGTSETISHVSAWDSTTAGVFQYSGALATPQPWASTNTLAITSHSISFAPIAA